MGRRWMTQVDVLTNNIKDAAKTCTKCGETKLTTEFYKAARSRDGLQCSCKACRKIEDAAYYVANREQVNAANKKYRAENLDKTRAVNLKWKAAWQKANPEACRISSHNYRASKRSNGGRLSHGLSDKLIKLQRGKCACGCGQSLGTDYHRDHIMPLALGGTNTDDNIQLLRKLCNLQKSAKHPVDFMQERGFLL